MAAAAVGICLIGILFWPMAKPAEPFGIVSLQNLNSLGIMEIIAISILCGFVGFLVSWPMGREIGIMAVPFGLAFLSIRTGSLSNLMQLNSDMNSRLSIFEKLRFESFFWLLLVFVGFVGVLAAERLAGKKEQKPDDSKSAGGGPLLNICQKAIAAVVGSVIIAGLGVLIFAQNVRFPDVKLGSVIVQPAVGQIVFAVILAFGIAGFLVKKFMNLSYIWPIIAAAFVTPAALIIYANTATIDYLAAQWPANFFANSIVGILPIQMVCFGSLGSIWGYWAAVRFDYWRHHQM
jgi:hypothetical protein